MCDFIDYLIKKIEKQIKKPKFASLGKPKRGDFPLWAVLPDHDREGLVGPVRIRKFKFRQLW